MSKKILIVDDSETARIQVVRPFIEAGYEVYEAEDGMKGLEKASQIKPDLIISDVNMPEMDGLTMCERLKEAGNTVPIMMMTTEGSQDMKCRGKMAGVVAWLTKPFNIDKMLVAVKKILSQ